MKKDELFRRIVFMNVRNDIDDNEFPDRSRIELIINAASFLFEKTNRSIPTFDREEFIKEIKEYVEFRVENIK